MSTTVTSGAGEPDPRIQQSLESVLKEMDKQKKLNMAAAGVALAIFGLGFALATFSHGGALGCTLAAGGAFGYAWYGKAATDWSWLREDMEKDLGEVFKLIDGDKTFYTIADYASDIQNGLKSGMRNLSEKVERFFVDLKGTQKLDHSEEQ